MFIKLGQQGNVVSTQFCSGLCEQGFLWHVCPTGQHVLTSGAGSAYGYLCQAGRGLQRCRILLHHYGICALRQGAARVHAPSLASVQLSMAFCTHAAFASKTQYGGVLRAGCGHIG